jgi:hypothetical protein
MDGQSAETLLLSRGSVGRIVEGGHCHGTENVTFWCMYLYTITKNRKENRKVKEIKKTYFFPGIFPLFSFLSRKVIEAPMRSQGCEM